MLSECVLVYLKPEESKAILTFFRNYFKGDLALLNYEMINPHDPFGKTMLENLEVKLFSFIKLGSWMPTSRNS
jgi:hypothetical protein